MLKFLKTVIGVGEGRKNKNKTKQNMQWILKYNDSLLFMNRSQGVSSSLLTSSTYVIYISEKRLIVSGDSFCVGNLGKATFLWEYSSVPHSQSETIQSCTAQQVLICEPLKSAWDLTEKEQQHSMRVNQRGSDSRPRDYRSPPSAQMILHGNSNIEVRWDRWGSRQRLHYQHT